MNIDALPPANEITQTEIRQAAETYDAARQHLKERQRAVRDLEDGRERAEWLDARAAEEALAVGKPSPKRHHLADHEKKADELAHELKVGQLATQRARADLQAVLDEHGDEWVESLAIGAEDLEHVWDQAVAKLIALHGERTALNALRRKLGADVPAIHAIRLKPEQLTDSLSGDRLAVTLGPDPFNPTAGQRRRAVINMGDVLAALSALGVEEEIQIVAGSLGERFKEVIEHSRTVERGYSMEEAREGLGPVVNGRPVSVYVPSAGGED